MSPTKLDVIILKYGFKSFVAIIIKYPFKLVNTRDVYVPIMKIL